MFGFTFKDGIGQALCMCVCVCTWVPAHVRLCVCVCVLEAVVQSRKGIHGCGSGVSKDIAVENCVCVKETTRSLVFGVGMEDYNPW